MSYFWHNDDSLPLLLGDGVSVWGYCLPRESVHLLDHREHVSSHVSFLYKAGLVCLHRCSLMSSRLDFLAKCMSCIFVWNERYVWNERVLLTIFLENNVI